MIRKAGSGLSPVSKRSGKAVMKITGISSNCAKISFTASIPEDLSANWISAKMRSGFSEAASATASLWVRAIPVTEWPISVTIALMSIAIMASSSITITRPATAASISSIALAIRETVSSTSICMIAATSCRVNPSMAFNSRASREFGVSSAICVCAIAENRESGSPSGAPALDQTR